MTNSRRQAEDEALSQLLSRLRDRIDDVLTVLGPDDVDDEDDLDDDGFDDEDADFGDDDNQGADESEG